jgi:hypothetical protein
MTLMALPICHKSGSTYILVQCTAHSTRDLLTVNKEGAGTIFFGLADTHHITSHTLLIVTRVCMFTKLTMSSDGCHIKIIHLQKRLEPKVV